MNKPRALQVHEVNGYVKNILEDNLLLSALFVEGEISNFKAHSSGHLYFTLKDSYAAISVVMFKNSAFGLNFEPENGMKIIIFGRVSIYEKTGQYQLYAETMEPLGLGGLYLSFEKLKAKLEAEGLFDDDRKKDIPEAPEIVAVITSKTGAALQDIISVTKRRNKNIELVLLHSAVQGEDAPSEIVNAIKLANEWKKPNVIILARGGGSIEDLWAFNDEKVARAIFKSKIPIISAVGHETDFTIADFVSDRRAPTPSAAAELAVPLLADKIKNVIYLSEDLKIVMYNKIGELKEKLERITSSKNLLDPITNIYNRQILVENLKEQLSKNMERNLSDKRQKLENKIETLERISPLKLMSRGYSIITKNSQVVESTREIKKGDVLRIDMVDGNVTSQVIGIRERKLSNGSEKEKL